MGFSIRSDRDLRSASTRSSAGDQRLFGNLRGADVLLLSGVTTA